jgi:hypothetical protein
LSLPFEKFVEKEMKTSKTPKPRTPNQQKHSFLKRKSQNLKPTKETEPKVKIQSKLAGYLQRVDESMEDLECEEKTNEEVICFPPEKVRKSLVSKNLKPSLEDLHISENNQQKTFLKKGEGKLCIQTGQDSLRGSNRNPLISPKSPDRKNQSPVYRPQKSASPENFSSKASASPENLRYKRSAINQRDKLKSQDNTYGKMIHQIEEKISKVEKESRKFKKLKENELKSLETWKNEERKKVVNHQKSLKNSKTSSIEPSQFQNMRKEIQQLSVQIRKNEEKYGEYIEDLKEVIEELSSKNTELLKKLQEKSHEFLDSKSLQNISEISPELIQTTPGQNNLQSSNRKSPPTFTLKLPTQGSEDRIGDSSILNYAENFHEQEEPKTEKNFRKNEENSQAIKIVSNEEDPEKRTQKVYPDGTREIVFSNGVKKEIRPDGFVVVRFRNNDVKEIFPDGKIVYHFFETKTVQTTFKDGLVLIEFPNGQIEKHFNDGSKEVKFPDQLVKYIFSNGEQEFVYPDGTLERVECDGVRIIEYKNGIRDVFLADGTKIRNMLDGSTRKYNSKGKIIY